MTSNMLVIFSLAVGFVAVSMLASEAPTVVNGILLLLLFGALLMNDTIWLPYLTQFGNAVKGTTTTTVVNAAGTSGPPPTGH